MTGLWRQRLGAIACIISFAACGGSPEADSEDDAVPVDTTFARVLADLHLADARAESTGEPADSLRRVALEANGLDSAAFSQQFRANTSLPEDVSALYGAVSDALSPSTPDRP